MKVKLNYAYLVIAVILLVIGVVGIWDPMFNEAKEGINFIGKSLISGILIMVGFYGLTQGLKNLFDK